MFNIKDVHCKLAGVWPRYGQVILVTLAFMEGWTVEQDLVWLGFQNWAFDNNNNNYITLTVQIYNEEN